MQVFTIEANSAIKNPTSAKNYRKTLLYKFNDETNQIKKQ